jgi:hypothetical protein
MAAEILASVGRKQQALIEYRLAAAGLRHIGLQWERIAERYPAVDDLLASCPKDVPSLISLGNFLKSRQRTEDADKVYSQALALAPEHLLVRQELVATALGRKQPALAVERARALVSRDRSLPHRLLLVRALIAADDLSGAERQLADVHERTNLVFRQKVAFGRALAARGELEPARKYLDSLTWPTEVAERALLHEARAFLETRAGNKNQAAWESQQAAKLRTTRTERRP